MLNIPQGLLVVAMHTCMQDVQSGLACCLSVVSNRSSKRCITRMMYSDECQGHELAFCSELCLADALMR